MQISPDSTIVFQLALGPLGVVPVSATIVNTWIVMALLVGIGRLATLGIGPVRPVSRWRIAVELLVEMIRTQIRDIGGGDPTRYLPFIGALFLFILTSNLLAVVPGFAAPTGSLSTATALAICVMVAVPLYAIGQRGLRHYLRSYLQPTPLMLPINLMGEVSRTVALAVRLYGNIMSGAVLVAILLSIVPFFFPIVMQVLGLMTGAIQAYIFAVLAMVYIASAIGEEPGAARPLPPQPPPERNS